MRLPVISFIALALFLVVQFTHLSDVKMISRETSFKNFQNKFHVEQGTSTDGLIAIKNSEHEMNDVGQRLKVTNHNRTLRAFLPPANFAGAGAVIIETARPHRFFILSGPFTVMNNLASLHWLSPTVLGVVSESVTEGQMEYVIDVRTLYYAKHVYDSSQKTENVEQVID